jgi:hypothetical protein
MVKRKCILLKLTSVPQSGTRTTYVSVKALYTLEHGRQLCSNQISKWLKRRSKIKLDAIINLLAEIL